MGKTELQEEDGVSQYTFVVDSDEALAEWADNAPGNDYTAVLIEEGTFTSSKEVNLTACGTKSVTGMPGSLLSFSSQYGLKYKSVPEGEDYFMDGVNVTGCGFLFRNCVNLTDCKGSGYHIRFHGDVFSGCVDLLNCTASFGGSGSSTCFEGCTNLTGCEGTGYGHTDGREVYEEEYGSGCGLIFHNCTNLTDCTATGDSGGISVGFYNCTNLVNCTGTANSSDYGYIYQAGICFASGFHNCTNLTKCTGTATARGNTYNPAYGFYKCDNLTASTGTGTGTGGAPGYNFFDCTKNVDVITGLQDVIDAMRSDIVTVAKGGGMHTFVVDSDEALAEWADNAPGNDYTAVLIAEGTFTSAKEVNLTACGTKTVEGMPGSLLSFSSQYGLRYTTRYTTSDYRMDRVNVNCTVTGFNSGHGFRNCVNLTNCTGMTDSPDYGYGFDECTNLTNCTVSDTSMGFVACTNLTDCTATSGISVAFHNCTNLVNCTGIGFISCRNLTACTSTGHSNGFDSCWYLTNCTGTGTGDSGGTGFSRCRYLTNCTGYGTATSTGTGTYSGFDRCTNLIDCVGMGHSGGVIPSTATYYGFNDCTNLTNCMGAGRSRFTMDPGNSVAFYHCHYLNNCTDSDMDESGQRIAFQGCDNLANCRGTGTGPGISSETMCYGFGDCTNLTNCTGTGIGTGTYEDEPFYTYGFFNCKNLTNCTGYGNTWGGGTHYIYGFGSCDNLTNCTGTGTSYDVAIGFISCRNLTNCTGTGSGTVYGASFGSCKGMVLNKPGSTASTTLTYSFCFVSISGTGEAPADTAAGGWNKVTV